MREHYERVVRDTDKQTEKSIRTQMMDESSPFYGGFPDERDIYASRFCVYRVTPMIACYSNQDSRYFHDSKLAERIMAALHFVRAFQHENGLFDLIHANFYSAPDTAFLIKRIFPCLHYLKGIERDENQEKMYSALYEITKRAAEGLYAEGGFHTPNHRWAIASNLVECADFFGEPKYIEEADKYLIEGIDCNEDGEFSERSSGNYNRVNNDAMITLGRLTGEERYFEYAVRNLRMMLTYIEPDGTIFTANSTRQDNGKRVYPTDYYWEYLTMGKDRNVSEFLGFANYIFQLIRENELYAPDILIHFMNRPELIDFEWAESFYPTEYKHVYRESGIVRIRRGDTTCTLMQGKPNFLYFANKSIDVALKIGGALCEHRAFVPESLEETEDGFVLKQVMKGWYYLPFKEAPATSDWWKMDHTKRDKKWGPNLNIEARVRLVEDGVEIAMKLDGVKQGPFRVEAAFYGADKADSEYFAMRELKGKYLVVKQGMVQLSSKEDAMEIGPGFGAHADVIGMTGSANNDPARFTVYFTDYTEFEHKIVIRNVTG